MLPKDWMVIEAIPPDREHGWQHVDRSLEVGDTKTKRIAGDLEYIRIGDDRYFRGDYHVVKMRPEELKTYSGNTCREWSSTWKIEETGQVTPVQWFVSARLRASALRPKNLKHRTTKQATIQILCSLTKN